MESSLNSCKIEANEIEKYPSPWRKEGPSKFLQDLGKRNRDPFLWKMESSLNSCKIKENEVEIRRPIDGLIELLLILRDIVAYARDLFENWTRIGRGIRSSCNNHAMSRQICGEQILTSYCAHVWAPFSPPPRLLTAAFRFTNRLLYHRLYPLFSYRFARSSRSAWVSIALSLFLTIVIAKMDHFFIIFIDLLEGSYIFLKEKVHIYALL